MADPPLFPDTGNDAGEGPDRDSAPSYPVAGETAPDQEPGTTGSWASKLVIAIVVALVVVIMILHLTGVVGPRAH